MSIPQISIVVPVFNSSNIAGELCGSIISALNSYSFEIILVNDGSRDNSWHVIRGLAKGDKRFTAIDLRYNSGQDNAIMAGIRESKGKYIVIMDDDLQHDPADIPALYLKIAEGFDIVFANFHPWKQSAARKTGSRMNGGFAKWLLGKPKGLYLSPFKIVTRSIADELLRFNGPYPYIDGILLTLTTNIGQITVTHHERHSGHSNYNFRRSTGVWFKLFTGFSVAPLRIATLTGLVVAIIGAVLTGYYLYEYFFLKRIVEGWITIVLLLIFFGGLILMMLGLLGEYIGRIYITVNGKPQYSIREIVKSGEQE
jgi:polyisoprenyl-phosphate glycosyltransferase